MGTRAKILIYGCEKKPKYTLCIYFDGYPTGAMKYVAEALAKKKLRSLTFLDEADSLLTTIFNEDDLLIQLIYLLKSFYTLSSQRPLKISDPQLCTAGDVFLCSPDEPDREFDYIYHIYLDEKYCELRQKISELEFKLRKIQDPEERAKLECMILDPLKREMNRGFKPLIVVEKVRLDKKFTIFRGPPEEYIRSFPD